MFNRHVGPRYDELNHNHQDDIVIAVTGTTGAGKSSFIQLLSGNANVHIGDRPESGIVNIQTVPFRDAVSGRNVMIVDIPSFDDSRPNITDADVLKMIADYLLWGYDENRKLNGLVYIQRISDPRFGGQSRRNLTMFRNLCGRKSYKNVVVLTTFWDQVNSLEEGIMREQQLKTMFFQDLVQGGACFMRHDRTIGGAHKVLKHILTLVPTNVRIQDEICLEGKTLEETAAGSVYRQEVAWIIDKLEKEMAEVKGELVKMKNSSNGMRRGLRQKRVRLVPGPTDDIVIALLGATGTGKSSFIKLLSGDTNVHIGQCLESETADIRIVPFHDTASGRNMMIVDTPGFDNSRPNLTDAGILKGITEFLLAAYDNNRMLNGLIYFQRISDLGLGGQSRRNLVMFRNICGKKAYENVLVLTTFWDQVGSPDEGIKREQQLKTTFFQDLANGGAQFMRHDWTIESARKVLEHILTLVPINIQVQEEIRLEGKELEETATGSVYRQELERIIEKHKKDIEEVDTVLEEIGNSNSDMISELEQERDN